MLEYELRITVEKVVISTQEVVKRDTIKVYDINPPHSILELGLRHEEQLSLLEKVQNSLLAEQTALIAADPKICPNCGQKLRKNGTHPSSFHTVFSDHQLRIHKHHCINPECHWSSSPTVKSVFGSNIHPDLAKLQCEQGVVYSYREAQRNLEKLNCKPRQVNNHTQVKRLTDKVGSVLSAQNLVTIPAAACAPPAAELIVQIDGGHIPIQDKTKRSFEALSGTVYRPDSIHRVDRHHREIRDKTCAISALSDGLQTMKTYLLNAALKQGMTNKTEITALADGAKNCWSVLSVLEPHCKKLVGILDWFHIGKKFQTVKNALEAEFEEALESSKWTLWHGNIQKTLTKLAEVQASLEDKKQHSKLTKLYEFIARNQAYIVNYEQRRQSELIFTSQTAESHVESLINARHKRSGKMQWNRESAHNVLQIRAKIASNEWDYQWQGTVLSALGLAV
jgi:hypothetical protein